MRGYRFNAASSRLICSRVGVSRCRMLQDLSHATEATEQPDIRLFSLRPRAFQNRGGAETFNPRERRGGAERRKKRHRRAAQCDDDPRDAMRRRSASRGDAMTRRSARCDDATRKPRMKKKKLRRKPRSVITERGSGRKFEGHHSNGPPEEKRRYF